MSQVLMETLRPFLEKIPIHAVHMHKSDTPGMAQAELTSFPAATDITWGLCWEEDIHGE